MIDNPNQPMILKNLANDQPFANQDIYTNTVGSLDINGVIIKHI